MSSTAWSNKLPCQVSRCASLTLNTEGTVTQCNSQTQKVFGWAPKEIIGRKLAEVIIPVELRKSYSDSLQLVTSERGVVAYRFSHFKALHRNGNLIPVNLNYITGWDKGSSDSLALFEDVSTGTIREVVHHLREHFIGRVDLQGDECIKHLAHASDQLMNLIDALLEYSYIDAIGKQPQGVFNLQVAMQLATDALQPMINETGAKIHYANLPNIRGNVELVSQLLRHLLANAMKFRGEKQPVIWIDAQRQWGFWVVGIQDNGVGFEPTRAEKVFQIFERASDQNDTGNGIGLAICKKIVEFHGGRIWAKSELNKGSFFCFSLPVAD